MKHWFDLLIEFPFRSKKTVLLILVVVVITIILHTIIAMWLSKFHLEVLTIGTIHTVGVEAYWAKNLTDRIDDDDIIDWGTLWPGSSNNVTIYLLNISYTETTLNLTKENLTFYKTNEDPIHDIPTSISTYMNLTWNYNGSKVNRGEFIPVTLTLKANYSMDFILYLIENDVKSFSLDILISTTEHTT
jgi:hypothetical protein